MISFGIAKSGNTKDCAILRVDGSPAIGMGHVMRCIALAQGLRDHGVEPVFVMKDLDPSVALTVKNYGFTAELLPAGCDIDEDVSSTLESARRHGTYLIFTDLGYLITSSNLDVYGRYHRKLKNPETYVVTLDVLYDGRLPSNLVINPYFFDKGRLASFMPGQHLNGPEFFLFRKEFLESIKSEHEIRPEVQNILVSFGGSDLKNATGTVVRALARSNEQRFHVRVILGQGYPREYIPDLTAAVGPYLAQYVFIYSSIAMADLLAWADLAILGGGLTKYEAAVTGTPALVIAQYESEIRPNVEFAAAGTLQYLGHIDDVKENDIREAVTKISADYPGRVKMAQTGRKLVDGKGVERILSKILKEVF